MSIAIRVNGRRRSSPPTPTYPVKGDVIAIDMDGDGTDEQYLVLKANGSVAEVLARVTPSDGTNIQFVTSGKNYDGSLLDTYLNTTYYATLSENAKEALVDKTFHQDSWYRDNTGEPTYNGSYGTNNTAYVVSLDSAAFGNEITRHIYTLSVQDIIDYLGVTPEMTVAESPLNMANMQELFNASGANYFWTMSGYASGDFVMRVYCNNGAISNYNPAQLSQARPAFQIDLSKITWTPIYNMTISGNGDSTYCYVVNTDAQTPQQYYTNGNTFSMNAGETLRCYVSGPSKRVTVDGVSQTLTDNAFNYIVNSNCTITMSFTINDHAYIDITT